LIFETINHPDDIRKLSAKELEVLAEELREFIIYNVSKTGGHLASSLGAVDFTLALHYCFNTPKDKIIWDVGHQTYAHKIITGRKDDFHTLRQYQGLSGFPKTKESEYDVFNVGHSSTSISAALGMALARDLKGNSEKIVAVIGDGALSSGIAYEGLDNAGYMDTDLIVVVNDNNMSISESLGAISTYLSKKMTGPVYNKLREEIEKAINTLPIPQKPTLKIARKVEESLKFFSPGLLFEELGFKYFGPINGHKIEDLIKIFNNAKRLKGPIVIHLLTTKGKGYKPAEENPAIFHGIGKFDVKTGKSIKNETTRPSYSSIFADKVLDIFSKKKNIVAITAAMLLGTGLEKVKNAYPERVFDVGIAEQHAVTMAGGLSMQGIKPIVAIYSTFLQRAYDQIIHDIALQKLPVVFAIDRAGIVGDDGETHQGSFDISYLNPIPNIVISAPKDARELEKMLDLSIDYNDGPFAIRYPRGESVDLGNEFDDDFSIGNWQILKEGKDAVVLSVGNCCEIALNAAKELSKENIDIEVVNARFIKPLDYNYLEKLASFNSIITIEENAEIGGFSSLIAQYLAIKSIFVPFKSIGLPDEFIEQGNQDILRNMVGINKESIIKAVKSHLKK
jgi:1-deoxy-D-xylulose-5-phosphate synthase